MSEAAEAKRLTISDAMEKVHNATANPPRGKARKWFDAAKVIADAIQEMRNREANIARRIEAAEREEAALDVMGSVQRRPLSRCGVAEKVRFSSHDAARKRIATIRSGDPLRAYFCEECDGWHLTSRKGKR